MNVETIGNIKRLLNTIEEAMEYARRHGPENVKKDIAEGRACITRIFEEEIKESLDRKINISRISDEEWLMTANSILEYIEKPFYPQNACDRLFFNIINDIWKKSEEEMLEEIKKVFLSFPCEERDYFENYLKTYPLWDSLDHKQNDWSSFIHRVEVIKRHSYDFIWLYRRLEDYMSKKTLIAILLNWKDFSLKEIREVKSIFDDYFEPDIIKNNIGEVFADIGAYVGDTIASYINFYGLGYKKIYAYEISSKSSDAIESMVKEYGLHDIIINKKGVSSHNGEMFLEVSEASESANKLSDSGKERIELVTIDDDAPDVTFIKMDIEGAEKDALIGCRKIITENHPKLAICVYHGYEDIWKIPLMINKMFSGYKMYIRHYGGEFPPTEFVLYCKQ